MYRKTPAKLVERLNANDSDRLHNPSTLLVPNVNIGTRLYFVHAWKECYATCYASLYHGISKTLNISTKSTAYIIFT